MAIDRKMFVVFCVCQHRGQSIEVNIVLGEAHTTSLLESYCGDGFYCSLWILFYKEDMALDK